MGTRVTIKGQVTLAKPMRDAAGIAPGDMVEIEVTASGALVLFKEGGRAAYRKRLLAAAGTATTTLTADELIALTRGED